MLNTNIEFLGGINWTLNVQCAYKAFDLGAGSVAQSDLLDGDGTVILRTCPRSAGGVLNRMSNVQIWPDFYPAVLPSVGRRAPRSVSGPAFEALAGRRIR
jgi:hypothetical protein